MKKKMYLLLTVVTILLILSSYFLTTERLQRAFLQDHAQIVEVDWDLRDPELFDQVINHLIQFSTEHNINIFHHITRSQTEHDIYLTNIANHPFIRLRSGEYPSGVYYLSNQRLVKNNGYQSGDFFFPGLNLNVRIFDFANVPSLPHILFITAADDIIDLLIEEFSVYGPIARLGELEWGIFQIEREDQGLLTWFEQFVFSSRYLREIETLFIRFRVLLTMMLISLIPIFFFIHEQRQQFLLKHLWGYSKLQIWLNEIKGFMRFYLLLLPVVLISFCLFFFFSAQYPFLMDHLLNAIKAHLFFFIILFSVIWLGIYFVTKVNEVAMQAKGKSLFLQIQGSVLLLKGGVYVLLFLSLSMSLITYSTARAEINALGDLSRTENVFRVQLSGMNFALFSNHEAMVELESRLLDFYQQISAQQEAFIIRPSNISRSAQDVVINENYLLINPIVDLDGRPVQEALIHDYYTLNVLVPDRLRYLEAEIIASYLSEFYLQAVTAANWTSEVLGEALVETTKDDLTIHIIYVRDDQEYFLFDLDINLRRNTIYNPIAMVVQAGMFDNSFIGSLVSSSLYFYDELGGGFATIEAAVASSGAVEIGRVANIHEQESRHLLWLHQQLIFQAIEFILILIVSIFMLVIFVWSHYQIHSYKLNLKYLFGYNYLQRHGNLIVSTLLFNLLSGVFLYFAFEMKLLHLSLLIAVLLLIDLLIVWWLSERLTKKSITAVLKGGEL